ncbi:hypothetical protein Vadar_034421 [Vaccinium darrowii]|uniref:Uncharacterized protein n=1 Tax=Vaccinium darrowii TaxID=229202 RepID=A0ACB7Z836_9ERIC|nr:hypothetical protein Vadar_034421 [Vaccinium darrowii]
MLFPFALTFLLLRCGKLERVNRTLQAPQGTPLNTTPLLLPVDSTIGCFGWRCWNRALEEKKVVQIDAKNAERVAMQSFQEKSAILEVYTKALLGDLSWLLAAWRYVDASYCCLAMVQRISDGMCHSYHLDGLHMRNMHL